MKVHLSENSFIAYGYERQARDSWSRDGIILAEQRACDQLMMKVESRDFLTEDALKVTCKHCKRTTKYVEALKIRKSFINM